MLQVVKKLLQKALAIGLIVSIAGCSSMHVIAEGDAIGRAAASPNPNGLELGVQVQLVMKNGEVRRLVPTHLDATTISGTDQGREYRIHVDQIARIERRMADPGQTTAVVALGIAAGVALLVSLVHSMEKSGPFQNQNQ